VVFVDIFNAIQRNIQLGFELPLGYLWEMLRCSARKKKLPNERKRKREKRISLGFLFNSSCARSMKFSTQLPCSRRKYCFSDLKQGDDESYHTRVKKIGWMGYLKWEMTPDSCTIKFSSWVFAHACTASILSMISLSLWVDSILGTLGGNTVRPHSRMAFKYLPVSNILFQKRCKLMKHMVLSSLTLVLTSLRKKVYKRQP